MNENIQGLPIVALGPEIRALQTAVSMLCTDGASEGDRIKSENEANELTYRLYSVSDAERALIDAWYVSQVFTESAPIDEEDDD